MSLEHRPVRSTRKLIDVRSLQSGEQPAVTLAMAASRMSHYWLRIVLFSLLLAIGGWGSGPRMADSAARDAVHQADRAGHALASMSTTLGRTATERSLFGVDSSHRSSDPNVLPTAAGLIDVLVDAEVTSSSDPHPAAERIQHDRPDLLSSNSSTRTPGLLNATRCSFLCVFLC